VADGRRELEPAPRRLAGRGVVRLTASAQPAIRTFDIDGVERSDHTHRTALIELYTSVADRTFLDVGAADGYESRALALRGARRTVAVEGKQTPFEQALAAKETLGLANHDVRMLDARRIDEHDLGRFDVVLCFGLLYHMANPFNLLRRLRAVTRELLLVETHVAPAHHRDLAEKHARLPKRRRVVELDGVPFEGLLVPHEGRHERSKGSLDAEWAFWLTPESLVTALTRAGFRIDEWHHELDAASPEPVRRWGERLGFGHANTKVWVVASPRPGWTADAVPPPSEHVVAPRSRRLRLPRR
jgi:SAM-dependent methyltransferase